MIYLLSKINQTQYDKRTMKGLKNMIDLHCHLLPGIDDGAEDLDTALAMAQISVDDGVEILACTPHIYPGLYENNKEGIRLGISTLSAHLEQRGIALRLVEGADVHVTPNLIEKIRDGLVPTINNSRYILLEPPHHVAPPKFEEYVFSLTAAGYVPVITHPERLKWIEENYQTFVKMSQQGAWMQITAGSLCGRFGSRPKYWAERMLDEGIVHILASDGHGLKKRPPLLGEGRDAAEKRLGIDEAMHLVWTRPLGIIENQDPSLLPNVPAIESTQNLKQLKKKGFWSLFSRT